MNIINIDNKIKKITIEENTIILFENDNYDIDISIYNATIYEYIKNSNTNIKYNILGIANINKFSINSSINVNITIENQSKLKYFYSCLNIKDNYNKINIYQKDDSESAITNRGFNIYNNKLDFEINNIIDKNLKNINSIQNSKIINFKNGKSYIKPNLIVDSNDVNVVHSSYIGNFKYEDLFYLLSRGINNKDAYILLIKNLIRADIFPEELYVKITKNINDCLEVTNYE